MFEINPDIVLVLWALFNLRYVGYIVITQSH